MKVYSSSGNVFADLNLPNSGELLIKAELAHQISELISARQLTQIEAAELLGIDQPKISALVRGKLSGFSTERLFRFLIVKVPRPIRRSGHSQSKGDECERET